MRWRSRMNIRVHVILLIFSLFIGGCSILQGEPDIEGYVIEVYENELLVVRNVSFEEFEAIQEIPSEDIHNYNLSLIYIKYEDAKDFESGNEIDIWLDGGILLSYPEQAIAKKIESKE